MTRGVRCRHFEGLGSEVDRGDAGVRKMVGERDGDGSRAGADVEDIQRLRWIEFKEDGLDEVFRFGSWDQNGGRDAEGKAVELLFAGDVLDRLVGDSPKYKAVVAGLLVESECAVGIGVQRGARDSQRVQKQQKRVAVCVGAKVG